MHSNQVEATARAAAVEDAEQVWCEWNTVVRTTEKSNPNPVTAMKQARRERDIAVDSAVNGAKSPRSQAKELENERKMRQAWRDETEHLQQELKEAKRHLELKEDELIVTRGHSSGGGKATYANDDQMPSKGVPAIPKLDITQENKARN